MSTPQRKLREITIDCREPAWRESNGPGLTEDVLGGPLAVAQEDDSEAESSGNIVACPHCDGAIDISDFVNGSKADDTPSAVTESLYPRSDGERAQQRGVR